MAGAKRRAAAEKKQGTSSSGDSSSNSRNPTTNSQEKAIPRLDGNRDPTAALPPVEYSKPTDLKNISEFLGLGGWYVARGEKAPAGLPQRPAKFNQNGKEAPIVLNTFNVIKAPDHVVHQYDVAWGKGTDSTKRVLVKKLWNSRAVQNALGKDNFWVYDGNKLAWAGIRLSRDETRILVDLDQEENDALVASGKPARNIREDKKGKNQHTIFIRWTRQVDFNHLQAFLNSQAPWSPECIDTINFLDHVMRETPSQRYTQIKKSFFQRGEARFDLGGGVEAFKGVFSSLRPVLNDRFEKSLSVNVDVANGTFWRAQEMTRAVCQVFNCSPPQFQQRFRDAKQDWKNSNFKKDLRRFKRVGVTAFHDPKNETQWTIDELVNMDPHEAKFDDRDHPGQKISVAAYFRQRYNLNPTAGLPVVKVTKKIRGNPVYLPLDWLRIDQNQRYNVKLSDQQTSQMIRFAVTLPKQRWEAVQAGVRLLDWPNDPYLNHYGLKISAAPAKVKARVLPSPAVHFGAGSREATIKPMDLIAGRWRLDGRKFAIPNDRAIRAWGVCVIQHQRGVNQPQTNKFIEDFIRIYEAHGGKFDAHPKFGKKPWMGPGSLADGGELVAKAFNNCGNHYNSRPNFMIFIVNDRNVDIYRRIKKSCDIRFGVASQVLQAKHVMTASPQYISNVCMKINAKMGGATSVAKSAIIPKINPTAAATPTMVIGADVSHPAPGSASAEAASYAAITVSSDPHFVRYWADVQTNGNRVEMVTTANIHDHFGPMAKMWMQRLGRGQPPKRVLYIRDGVSEGQYAQVLAEEVRDMKETFVRLGCTTAPLFTVVIAGKRHHIRFFPEKGDRNSNPLPGTLVESGCTHPFEFDFYLCSHVAIKGTARPIHYQCILNEGNWQSTELEQFIFEHSYHYVRSTTPVSLHPAVYYAHLAADRARAHVSDAPVSSGKKEAKGNDQRSSTGSSNREVEVAPLQKLNNAMGLKEVMWYI
ncbi:eukaryotic translation initiation factor 2C 2 [Byssothecium circinans]|uniref:Eukaryotic translation initiation factor 2C 2 n=1 Tax=Byssothecium circinans TaxID=147558 RepID=A0A6A5TD53_9PLEO|nr:eukaryotic translation initiation factor 2C 2 [Byssothecium circinans]